MTSVQEQNLDIIGQAEVDDEFYAVLERGEPWRGPWYSLSRSVHNSLTDGVDAH